MKSAPSQHNPLSAAWQSPSNIAIVKYWGKKGFQIPANPSVSMTLSRSVSETRVTLAGKSPASGISCEVWFEGARNQKFEMKIKPFLETVSGEMNFIRDYHLLIETRNTFPHSTGIASSASGLSALSLCLIDLHQTLSQTAIPALLFRNLASQYSRLGSGSACRSVYGNWALWGQTPSVFGSSDEFAVPLDFEPGSHFKQLQDSILMVSSKEKSVSSRAGHSLMENHPFAPSRYQQAHRNIIRLLDALKTNNWKEFEEVTENEALTLHALMMNSNPWFLLLEPESIRIIHKIREFRNDTASKVCFTIDAGPNIHLLYPLEEKQKIRQFIETELTPFLEHQQWIDDSTGSGPVKLNNFA